MRNFRATSLVGIGSMVVIQETLPPDTPLFLGALNDRKNTRLQLFKKKKLVWRWTQQSLTHLLSFLILFCFCFIIANEMQKYALLPKVIFLLSRRQ